MATEELPQEEQGPLPRTPEAVDWWLKRWGRTEPLTREDVERLIKANRGTPEGLDLGGRDLHGADLFGINLEGAYLAGIDLQRAHLNEASLQDTQLWRAKLQGAELRRANIRGAALFGPYLQGAVLVGANLQGAVLVGANLQGAVLVGANLQDAELRLANLQGAVLVGANLQDAELRLANLQGASLSGADLRGADLRLATLQSSDLSSARLDGANFEGLSVEEWTNMEGVRLYGATITETTKLRRVLWGEKMTLGDEVDERWEHAIEPYRDLKQWYQRTGDYDIAGRFHYREWECKRKLAQQLKKPVEILELWVYRLLSGYGERPKRVIGVGAALILLFALFYMPWNNVDFSGTEVGNFFTHLWKALYFSGVSFTALGYGGWVDSAGIAPTGWARYLGVVESLIGISLIALFLVTFTRKMSR